MTQIQVWYFSFSQNKQNKGLTLGSLSELRPVSVEVCVHLVPAYRSASYHQRSTFGEVSVLLPFAFSAAARRAPRPSTA